MGVRTSRRFPITHSQTSSWRPAMRMSVITDEISQDFERALDVMSEYGVRGAELRGLWGANVADLTDEQIVRAKSALDARGIGVIGLSTPVYKCELESDAASVDGAMHLA